LGPEAIPIVLGGITLITPIVFILTKHQQKMAMILNSSPSTIAAPTQSEISALKELVHQQSIVIDNLAKSHESLRSELKANQDLRERISTTT
jgi:hypothetical protein